MAKQQTPAISEYRLLVTPHFNERGQKYTTLVRLETVKAFASFQYELSVEEELGKKLIKYRVRGLKTPHLSLPASGHAGFEHEYEDLKGTYEITVEGLDGKTNAFTVRIAPEQVKVTKSPPEPFVHLITDKRLWLEK